MSERRAIFISYRREDEPGYTQSLYLMLEQAFGAACIFKDIEGGLRPGDDFPNELRHRIEDCDIVIAVIGPRWFGAADEKGRRAIDKPTDWVRTEIVTALEQSKRVIPVLVNRADFLQVEDLPEPLQPLSRKQFHRLTNERFIPEARVLIASLEPILEAAEAERADAVLRARAEAERRAEEEAARQREEVLRAQQSASNPADLSPETIAEAKELANWIFIAPRRNIAEHRDHVARYGGGSTSLYARSALEELVWAATDSASADSLRTYLDEFPQGAHAAEAERALKEREAEAEAMRAIEQRALEERLTWAEVNVPGDKAAIQAFLAKYPDGEHSKAARRRLRELRKSTTRRWLLGGAAAGCAGAMVWSMQPGNSLWRALFDESLRTFPADACWVDKVTFAPDGKTVIWACIGDTFVLWDVASESLRTFSGHTGFVSDVAFAPDGKTMISGSWDKTLQLWDVATGESLRTFTGHTDKVNSVAFAPDGKTVISWSWGKDKTRKLWNVRHE